MSRDEEFVVGSLFGDATEDEPTSHPVKPDVPLIRIEAVPLQHILDNDKVLYNNNNLHQYAVDPSNPLRLVLRSDGPCGPLDYHDVHERCSTRHWVDEFRTQYRVLNLPKANLQWMQEASHLAVMKAGLSPLFVEDIKDTVAAVDVGDTFAHVDRSNPTTGYFVRTETVSLKEGIHGVGPYFDLQSILESSVTAGRGHQAVDQRTASLKYYLFPWRADLHKHREFRVFVCEGRVTAISQQALYSENSILSLVSDATDREKLIKNWVRILVPYIHNVVVNRLALRSFVLDIVLVGPPPTDASRPGVIVDLHEPQSLSPYFIETNAFGFNYGAGSSLFNWIEHYSVLYGLDAALLDTVYFRYTCTSS